MPRTGKPARAIVAAMLVTLTLVASTSSFAPASASGLRSRMLRQVNEIRERRDVRTLKIDRRLSRKAARHTRAMIRKNSMFHTPNLSGYMANRSLTPWGENLGCGDTVNQVLRRLMRSSAHRRNIVNRRFRKVGLGVVEARRRNMCGRRSVWTTQIFYAR